MRRLPYLIVAVLLVASLSIIAACGDDAGDETSSTASGAGGTEPTATGDSTTSTGGAATTGGPQTTGAGGQDQEGAQVFASNCASCHGAQGEGAGAGPNLQTRTDLDEGRVEEQVRKGGNGMPAFEGTLSDDQIKAVTEFVLDSVVNQ